MFEPFQYEFFVNGIVAAGLAGALTGLVGVYIVLRKMAYIGHGLSHAIFGGAVVSFVMSINFFLGASAWGVFSALLITITARKRTIGADAAIGIITTASFALGIAIISKYKTFTRSFDAALFGNVLGVSDGDLLALAIVLSATICTVFVGYKLLLFTAFDSEVGRLYGVPTGWVDIMFSLILAATIVVSMQVLGVTLIAANVVIPPIIARMITNSFRRMIVLSTVVGSLCGIVGIYLSYYIDVSSGATIVLVGSTLFVLALLYNTIRARRYDIWTLFKKKPAIPKMPFSSDKL